MIEPKLRFKADDGSQFPDWEEKTFNDVADYKKGPFGSALKKEIFVPKSNDTVKVYEQQNAISKEWKHERYFVTNEYFQSKMKSFAVSGGDIIVSCAGTIGEMYELPDDAEEGIINQALMRVRIKKSVINSIIFRCIFDKMISTEGIKISNGSALKNIPPFADMKKQTVFVPSLPEQQKMAKFLSTIDTVIEKQKKTVSAWEERKKGVMQKLFSRDVRFKTDDGSDFPEWDEKRLGDILTYEQPIKYIVKSTQYNDNYNIPVLTAGQSLILGYTDEMDGVYDASSTNPVIIFDDFTTSFHWIDFSFKVKSSAMKLLTLNDDKCNFSYVYNTMRFMDYVPMSHSRQWISTYSKFKVPVPCLAEQQKIADCLLSLDEVIKKKKKTLAAWEELRKGLLQQMFV